MGEDNKIVKILGINVQLAVILGFLFFILPFMEGASGQITLTNLPAANQLLTASYALYAFAYFANSFSIMWFGRQIMMQIGTSLKFHKSRSVKDKVLIRQLQKALGAIKPAVFFSSTSLNTGGGSVLIMAFARYYIWSVEGWSIFFMFGYIFFSGISTSIFPIYMFCRELYLRHKYGPDYHHDHSGSSHRDSSVNGRSHSKSPEKTNDRSSVGPDKEASGGKKSEDLAMDEFMNSRA